MTKPDERRFRSRRAAVVRPNRALFGAVLLAAIGAVAAPIVLGKAFLGLSFILGLVMLGGLASLRERRWPRLEQGVLEADATGVRHDGKPVVSRAAITQGHAVPVADGCLVRLDRRWPRTPVDLVVWDESHGRRMLVALGLDASQTTAELRGGSGYRALSEQAKWGFGLGVGAFVLAAVQLLDGTGLTFWLWAALILTMRFVIGQNSKIRVGVDGIEFRWLWVRQFTRFADVATLQLFKHGKEQTLHLRMTDGTVRKLPLAGESDAGEASFVYSRIVQAYQAFSARKGSADIEALARGDRPAIEWLKALRGLAAGANAGMRTAPVPIDRLWAILDDPSAPAAARAGAAASLASTASDTDKQRIRIAAATVAEPKLRVAIALTAEPEISDDALAEALAEVDAPAPPKRVRGG